MKALVFQGPGSMAWTDVPDAQLIDPTDVVVRVDTTTICGTDLHILKGDVPAVTAGRVLGHEAVGVITEVGSAVTSLAAGDRVLVPAITTCGKCASCRSAMPSHCATVGGIGWIFGHLIDGTQAEYVRVPYAETSVHVLPKGAPMRRPSSWPTSCPPVSKSAFGMRTYSPGTRSWWSASARSGSPRSARPGCTAPQRSSRSIFRSPGSSGHCVRRRQDDQQRARRRAGTRPGDHQWLRRERRHRGRRHPGDVRAVHHLGASRRSHRQRRCARRTGDFHLEDLWIKNITMTTGLVNGTTVRTLLELLAQRKDRRGCLRHALIRSRPDGRRVRRLRARRHPRRVEGHHFSVTHDPDVALSGSVPTDPCNWSTHNV